MTYVFHLIKISGGHLSDTTRNQVPTTSTLSVYCRTMLHVHFLTIQCWTLCICNIQSDAQNAECYVVISALMRPPFKFQSSADHFGNLIPVLMD